MLLFNPTPEEVIGGFNGTKYPITPGQTIEMTEMIGNWVLSRCEHRGLVALDISKYDLKSDDLENGYPAFKRFIVEQSYKGLERYIELKNGLLEQWVSLDTEIKAMNQFGTVLQNKGVKEVTHWISIAEGMITNLQQTHGIDFKKDDIIQKSAVLQDSIDQLIKDFEADAEKKSTAQRIEREINQTINEIMPRAVNVTGNTSMTL